MTDNQKQEREQILTKVANIIDSFQLTEDVFLLGCLEKRVTVFKQQVRAHNLIWALGESRQQNLPKKIVVVGGGLGGMTCAACILSLFPKDTAVTILERHSDLCPYQQGCDIRWLHPKIYDWPKLGSRAPSASLPVLNWSEGRASDVARTALKSFGQYCDRFDSTGERLRVFLQTNSLRIEHAERKLQWKGAESKRQNAFFKICEDEREMNEQFNMIIVASGFGLEKSSMEVKCRSYWRNEEFGQPNIKSTSENFLVSGYGDGALTDVCRLTIERFRQDTILYELCGDKLREIESKIRKDFAKMNGESLYSYFQSSKDSWLSEPLAKLVGRIRKDSKVVLNARGDSANDRIEKVFEPQSSFSNRMLTFLLLECQALEICFLDLEESIAAHSVPAKNVICRHGCNTIEELQEMFYEHESLTERFKELQSICPQVPELAWRPGVYPSITQ